jgi:plasmid stabilization system protein ParE
VAKVIWTKPALNDVHAAFDYLAKSSGSADVAERICIELLDAAYDRLARLPDSGARVEELAEIGAREIYKHSYRIIYLHRGDTCYIIQCIHSSRDLIRHLDPERWADIIRDEEAF